MTTNKKKSGISGVRWLAVGSLVGVIVVGAILASYFYAPVTTQPASQYRMALVLGGDETDAGWSFMAVQGAQLVEEKYGWDVDISRLVSYADAPRVINDYAQRGYDLIWAQGGQFVDAIYQAAPVYEGVYFSQVSGPEIPLPPPNVVTLHPAFQTTGFYEAGVLAGEMTETDAIAVIIGQWYPYLAMEYYAFEAGVESVNSEAKVFARVAGTWGDASLGFQIAESLILTKDVDIIVQVADLTGRGVISAAQKHEVKVIGTVADQAMLAPEITLTSVMMDTPGYMEMIVQHIMDGTFEEELGGTVADVDLGYLAPFHQFDDAVPQDLKNLLSETAEATEAGSIVVPRIVTDEAPSDPN